MIIYQNEGNTVELIKEGGIDDALNFSLHVNGAVFEDNIKEFNSEFVVSVQGAIMEANKVRPRFEYTYKQRAVGSLRNVGGGISFAYTKEEAIKDITKHEYFGLTEDWRRITETIWINPRIRLVIEIVEEKEVKPDV